MKTLLVALLAGLSGATLGWVLGRTPNPQDNALSGEAAAGVPQPPSEAPAERLRGVSHDSSDQVATLAKRIGSLEAKVDALPALIMARIPVDRAASGPVDGEALVRAFEQATARRAQDKLMAMTDAELLVEGRRLTQDAHDHAAARTALKLLLDRQLTPADRASAMTELGITDRNAGELEASATILQQTIDTFGADTEAGAWAGFQLMWTLRGQGNLTRALAVADRVANATQSNESLRLHGRWHAAQLAQELGNVTRARADFESIVREFGDRNEYSMIVEDCKRRL